MAPAFENNASVIGAPFLMPNAAANSPATSHQTTWAHLGGWIDGALQYLKARTALLLLEAKRAGVQYGVGLALGAGGLFVAVLGYMLLVITAVFAIAALW